MTGLIIISTFMAIISSICFIYSMFAFKEKGPILTNEYILATDEERKKLERQNPLKKSNDYRFAARMFLGISIMFLFMFIGCILLIFDKNGIILFIASGFVAVFLIVFALVSSIKAGEFR